MTEQNLHQVIRRGNFGQTPRDKKADITDQKPETKRMAAMPTKRHRRKKNQVRWSPITNQKQQSGVSLYANFL